MDKFSLPIFGEPITTASEKSINFIKFVVYFWKIMILQGWTSRCEIPLEWQYLIAVNSCYKMEIMSETPSIWFYKNYYANVLPGIFSKIIYKKLLSKKY